MPLSNASRLIETRLAGNWSDTPVEWPNVEPGEDLRAAKDDGSPWLKLTVQSTVRDTASLGPDVRYRTRGIIGLQINFSKGSGTREALKLAEKARAIFEGQRFANVVVKEGPINGPIEFGEWVQYTVSLRFRFDDTLNDTQTDSASSDIVWNAE